MDVDGAPYPNYVLLKNFENGNLWDKEIPIQNNRGSYGRGMTNINGGGF